jgi:hypothetical protein
MSKTTSDQNALLPAVDTTAAAVPAETNKAVAAKATAAKPVAPKPAAKVSSSKVAVAKKVAAPKVAKVVKEKTPKLKMERDSFTMPKIEYAQFHLLKERLQKLGQPAKKSELLRAGMMQLAAMTDAALKAAMSKVPTIKTGRPKK